MVNQKLFFSTGCINENSQEKALVKMLEMGIKNIELTSGKENGDSISDFLKELKHKEGLSYLIHNYFPKPKEDFVLNIASQNKKVLQKTLVHCKSAISLCQELGSPYYSVHAGLRLDPRPGELGKPIDKLNIADREAAYTTMLASVNELCSYARKRGVVLAIENHVVAEYNLVSGKNEILLLCESSEIDKFLEDADSENLRLLIDLGHLNVTSKTLNFRREEFLRRLKDRIAIFHLSENDGVSDMHAPIKKTSWFFDYIADSDALFVIEGNRIEECEIRSSESACREMLAKKNRILK